jgi:hypothetical protein
MATIRSEREPDAHEAIATTEQLTQLRDLGGRLEHVVAQYDRLVCELFGTQAAPSGFTSHVHLVNRELGHVTRRLQDLMVHQDEARRNRTRASTREPDRGRRERRQAAPLHAVDRPSVIKPFIPAAHRHRVPTMPEPTRIAAVR